MNIITMPIEPLVERYSAQWLTWVEKALRAKTTEVHDFHYTIWSPAIDSNTIKTGEFLDVFETNIYKARLLEQVIKYIESNQSSMKDEEEETVIWVHDGWYPGIEALAYIRDAAGLNFKIAACLHAGTWDKHDFISRVGMARWASSLEESWMKVYDYIFVATKFHKKLLLESGRVPAKDKNKIFITGFPIYPDAIIDSSEQKEDIIVFPHRLAPEKNPDIFWEFAEAVSKIESFKDYKFLSTKEETKGLEPTEAKKKYYEILSKAKYAVSFADQETWGIAMQEAVFAGCLPIVPRHLSYQEMYPYCYSFYGTKNITGAINTLLALNSSYDFHRKYLSTLQERFRKIGSMAFDNMLDTMTGRYPNPKSLTVSPYSLYK